MSDRWDPAQAEAEKGTVIIWTRSLARDFSQVRDPESADFCSRSPILMVARRGGREGRHEKGTVII